MFGKTSVSSYLARSVYQGKPRFPRIQPARRVPVKVSQIPRIQSDFPVLAVGALCGFLKFIAGASPHGELLTGILMMFVEVCQTSYCAKRVAVYNWLDN